METYGLTDVADFGPTGFRTAPAIAEILDPLLEKKLGGIRRWKGLGDAEGRLLLREVPEEVQQYCDPGVPSLADGVASSNWKYRRAFCPQGRGLYADAQGREG